MAFFPWRWAAIAAVVLALVGYGFYLGNAHGANARAYRAVVAELARKNAELSRLAVEDARFITEGDAARDAAFAATAGIKSCPASKALASTLSAIKE